MSIDTIGDFLTIIRNGLMVSKAFVVIPHSKVKFDIANILKQEGFIKDCSVINAADINVKGAKSTKSADIKVAEENPKKKAIKVILKYLDNESAIHEITRISTPGRRFYSNSTTIKPVIGGLGVSILSTNQGIMTDKKAKELNVGGEVICTVW